MKFLLVLAAIIPALVAVAVPAPEAEADANILEARACPSSVVVNSCWGECKKAGRPTDKCYNCCYNTCRPC